MPSRTKKQELPEPEPIVAVGQLIPDGTKGTRETGLLQESNPATERIRTAVQSRKTNRDRSNRRSEQNRLGERAAPPKRTIGQHRTQTERKRTSVWNPDQPAKKRHAKEITVIRYRYRAERAQEARDDSPNPRTRMKSPVRKTQNSDPDKKK
jgi:hypothetical protein